MTWEDFGRTPLRIIDILIDKLPGKKAEIELMLANGASFPYMDRSDRRSEASRLRRQVYGDRIVSKVLPPNMLGKIGIGYRSAGVSTETGPDDKSD